MEDPAGIGGHHFGDLVAASRAGQRRFKLHRLPLFGFGLVFATTPSSSIAHPRAVAIRLGSPISCRAVPAKFYSTK
jgi:hypothetical protein